MTKFKLLFITLMVLSFFGFSGSNSQDQTIKFKIAASELNSDDKTNVSDPSRENIIQALEKRIIFCRTATKEQFAEYLGASVERLNSVSDEELYEIREDNVYIYQNIIDSLNTGVTQFELLSKENDSYKYSFSENGSDSFAMIMSFKLSEGGLLLE